MKKQSQWTETETGVFAHQSEKAVVTTLGRRWIAVVEGNTLTGAAGGTRYFGGQTAAQAAAVAKLEEQGIAVEAPATGTKPLRLVGSETKRPRQESAPPAVGFQELLGADEELEAALAEAGWSRDGIEAGKLAGPQGSIEVTGNRGSWIARPTGGEALTGPAGGKRLFKFPSKALRSLLAA